MGVKIPQAAQWSMDGVQNRLMQLVVIDDDEK